MTKQLSLTKTEEWIIFSFSISTSRVLCEGRQTAQSKSLLMLYSCCLEVWQKILGSDFHQNSKWHHQEVCLTMQSAV